MKPNEWARKGARLLGNVLHGAMRVVGWLFLIGVLFGAGVGAYVYRTFSPENARQLAADQLTALMHRQVTIERLVLSPRGLKVLGLRVRRGRGDVEGDLLTCGSALVTVKLKPLLQRRLEFDTIVLQSPQISLSRDEQGVWNISDVFGSTGTPRSALLPVAMASAETDVEDGVLIVNDRMRGRRISFEKLTMRVDDFDLGKPFPVETSFTTSGTFGGRAVTAAVDLSANVNLARMNWSSATATADHFRVQSEGLTLTGRASVVGFSSPRIDAEVAVPALSPDALRRLFGRGDNVSLPPTRWTLKAGVPAAGMLDVEKLFVQTPAGNATATGLLDFAAETPTLSVELEARDADVATIASWLPEAAPHVLSGKATLRASLTGWPGRFQEQDAALQLRGFGGTWGDRRVEGADLDVSAADDFSKLKATAMKGKVTAIGNVFDEIAGSVTADRQNVTLERLVLRWDGSRVRLRAKAARREKGAAPKELELSGSVDKVDWDAAARLWWDIRSAISTRTATADDEARPWLRTLKYSIPHGFPDTTGHVRVGEISHPNFSCKDVELMWNLRGVTPALDKVSGEARLSFGPGRVNDIQAMQDSNKFLRVVFLPFIFMHKMNKLSVFSTATAYPKSLDFRRIDGEYGAVRGVATTRYFHEDSDQLVAYADGTVDFGREQVDMNILTRLGSYEGTLPEWWVDEKGRPAIGFRVKGDISKPDLQPRFKKIEENEIERDVEQGREGARKRFENLEKLQTF
jgi:hypothetical protein